MPGWAERHRHEAESYRAKSRELYGVLVSQIREELRQGREPAWRRAR
jgi:hypothetical protein